MGLRLSVFKTELQPIPLTSQRDLGTITHPHFPLQVPPPHLGKPKYWNSIWFEELDIGLILFPVWVYLLPHGGKSVTAR